MKKAILKSILITLITFFLTITCTTAQGFSGRGGGSGNGQSSTCGNAGSCDIQALPAEPLSLQEIDAVTHMREEEKLARDVYLNLNEIEVNIMPQFNSKKKVNWLKYEWSNFHD